MEIETEWDWTGISLPTFAKLGYGCRRGGFLWFFYLLPVLVSSQVDDGIGGTFCGTETTFLAVPVVDLGQIVFHLHCVIGTHLNAEAATDACFFADSSSFFTPIQIAARDEVVLIVINGSQANEIPGTGRHTVATSSAVHHINAGEPLFHIDSIEGAGVFAVAKAKTSVEAS